MLLLLRADFPNGLDRRNIIPESGIPDKDSLGTAETVIRTTSAHQDDDAAPSDERPIPHRPF